MFAVLKEELWQVGPRSPVERTQCEGLMLSWSLYSWDSSYVFIMERPEMGRHSDRTPHGSVGDAFAFTAMGYQFGILPPHARGQCGAVLSGALVSRRVGPRISLELSSVVQHVSTLCPIPTCPCTSENPNSHRCPGLCVDPACTWPYRKPATVPVMFCHSCPLL